MLRLPAAVLLTSVFLGGCVPLNMHGALREAFDKAEADKQAVKMELAQASAESKRLQQEAASLRTANEALTKQARDLAANLQQINREKAGLAERVASAQAALAAREAEKTALAVKAEEQALALQRMEALRTPPPAHTAEPEREQPSRTLEAALKDEMANGNGSILREGGTVIIELLEPALYHNSASATLKPDGLKVLKRVVEALKDGGDKEIRIEAHTDVVIQTSRFASSMDLAVARANGVLRFLKTQHATASTRMSAVGYAEARPALAGDRAQPRSRRLEIIVRAK